jgi:maltooligosyltrehalose trehalohydrolase
MTSRVQTVRASFGATAERGATSFRVWAPAARRVSLQLESGRAAGGHRMSREADGTFVLRVRGATAGDLYRYRIDGSGPFPDPASRFQPFGVHGPSEIVDPAAFTWTDRSWRGIDAPATIVYELHVGTFTPEGTFAAAAARLPYLEDLGVTAIELMPIADFAGDRNWGYDGVCLFAPARCYGRPDDLRALVNAAHQHGLAVHIDLVYNHLGPDGAYMSAFTPLYFTPRHCSPWGDGVNLDGEGSFHVRRFIVENALHWIAEYHVDGLRLDATHALEDDSPVHIVAELVDAVREQAPHVLVVAEDDRNLAAVVRSRVEGGWALDGVWADDFHHIMRRILAGDSEGYYAEFAASVEDLAATLGQGWYYVGQPVRTSGRHRGSDPAGIPLHKFVICIQNHDQIGNRAFGERLPASCDPAAYRAASAVLLLAPETPLLFMGQEWAASTPFLFFTDHHTALGEQIVQGRRREFEKFSAFRDQARRELIPDPQAPHTFLASRLDWSQPPREPHAGTLRLYRRLLHLRRTSLVGQHEGQRAFQCASLDADTLLLRHTAPDRELLLVARLRGQGTVAVPALPRGANVLMTTEDADFVVDGRPPSLDGDRVRFRRPSALVISTDERPSAPVIATDR